MGQGIQILSLCQNAQRLLELQAAREKRCLLNFVLSNSSWMQGELSVKFEEPLDLLAATVKAPVQIEATQAATMAGNEVWLSFVDVYRTKCVGPAPSFRLRLEQGARLGFAA